MAIDLKSKIRRLSLWQKYIVTKQKMGEEEIPHPAVAPISTDQEAGGPCTTPDGEIVHAKKTRDKSEKSPKKNAHKH